MSFSNLDYMPFALYIIGILALSLFVSSKKAGHKKDSKDYFLADNRLTWWSIGASLIKANISAEQIIGRSGSGLAIGLAIASYKWMSDLK